MVDLRHLGLSESRGVLFPATLHFTCWRMGVIQLALVDAVGPLSGPLVPYFPLNSIAHWLRLLALPTPSSPNNTRPTAIDKSDPLIL